MNIILMGPPGSGKGTQAKRIAEEFDLYLLQTGVLARELIRKDKRLKEIYDSGKLIPEQEMTMHVIDFLSKQKPEMNDILFDGFPRFITQYEALEEFLKNKGDDIDLVLMLDISKKEAIKRISSRRTCDKCAEVYNLITNPPPKKDICKCGGKLIQRADSKPEAIEVRFEWYRDNTKKLVDYLDDKGKLTRIDGERAIDVIFEDILAKVKKIRHAR